MVRMFCPYMYCMHETFCSDQLCTPVPSVRCHCVHRALLLCLWAKLCISHLKLRGNLKFKYVLYPVILVAKSEHMHCQLYVRNVHVCHLCGAILLFCYGWMYIMWQYCFYQVVAGALVRLTLELGYTTCRKGEDGDVSNCQLKEDSVMSVKCIFWVHMIFLMDVTP